VLPDFPIKKDDQSEYRLAESLSDYIQRHESLRAKAKTRSDLHALQINRHQQGVKREQARRGISVPIRH
jgi:hypothetical protein